MEYSSNLPSSGGRPPVSSFSPDGALTLDEEQSFNERLERIALSVDQKDIVVDAMRDSGGSFVRTLPATAAQELLAKLRPDTSKEQLQELFENLDVGYHGQITPIQFLSVVQAVTTYALERKQLRQAFQLFDCDSTGTVPLDDLKKALQSGPTPLTEAECNTFFSVSGCKGEMHFDFQKFVGEVMFSTVNPKPTSSKKRTAKK